ncbi:MAG: diguanylate cyclase [Bradymonadaceae bacterium]|nr:diguanylate cyclase [Lujinxingiaceae bacterium]
MKSILFVLDDPELQNLYGRLLEQHGHRVVHVHRGAQALPVLADQTIDLLVIDDGLVDEEVRAFVTAIRHSDRDVPIVLLAAPVDDSVVGHASRNFDDLPVDLIARKPLSPVELAHHLDKFLGVWTSEAEHQPGPGGLPEIRLGRDIVRVSSPQLNAAESPGSYAATILVIDADERFLNTMVQSGEQLLVRVLTATGLDRAKQILESVELDGIFVTVADEAISSVSQTVQALVAACASVPPLALVYEKEGLLDRVQGLYAGAALILQKPLDRAAFSQAVHHLSALRRREQTSVLLIDHDLDFARTLEAAVRAEAMAVHHLEHPAHVLDELERTNPDALMINVVAQTMSGIEICRILRTIPRWQDLPILFVTNKLCARERLAGFEAGGDDYLVKPISAEELRARLLVRIQRTRLLRDRADRDMLTGLLTRRAFVEQFAGRLAEVSRHGRPLAFCLLDLDHFKYVNDVHGHLAGDRVLVALGQLLSSRFRIEDIRARWGGEEFAVVLVNEDANTARRALQRVANEFSSLRFEREGGDSFNVTFSAGIAQFPRDGQEPEELLQAADQRLLHAKQTGRNLILPAVGVDR